MYMTLPSNTGDFSANTTNHFRVQLPAPLSLHGSWEVALIDIEYPVSWSTLKAPEGKVKLTCYSKKYNIDIPISIRVPPGYYRNVKDLLEAFQQELKKKGRRLQKYFHNIIHSLYKIERLKIMDYELYNTFPKFSKKKTWSMLRKPKLIPEPRAKKILDFMVPVEEDTTPPIAPARRKKSNNEQQKYTLSSQQQQQQQQKDMKARKRRELIQTLEQLGKEKERSHKELDENPINLLSEELKAYYSEEKQRVVIEWNPSSSIKTIKFDHSLQFLFGFDSQRKIQKGINIGDYNIDIRNSQSSFFVYCNLIQLQTVGNSLKPLLRTVPVVSSALGNIVHKAFSSPHYVDVLTRQFDTVEIWIANDSGELIDFQFGKVILKLHFRRRTLLAR